MWRSGRAPDARYAPGVWLTRGWSLPARIAGDRQHHVLHRGKRDADRAEQRELPAVDLSSQTLDQPIAHLEELRLKVLQVVCGHGRTGSCRNARSAALPAPSGRKSVAIIR